MKKRQAKRNRLVPLFINDYGDEAACVVCGEDAEWHCRACDDDVCETHVAFVHHDCPSILEQPREEQK